MLKMKLPLRRSHKKRSDVDNASRILNCKSDFYTVETYKSIRTNIMFSMPKTEKGKVIAITSSIPGEGKTTTSINLAITFAEMGAKVILVDCDLRRARIHKYLQIERGKGVSNVLCGFCTLDDAIRKNLNPNIDILSSGELPPNPAELLGSKEFAAMIEALTEKYDYIFIDTPPLTVVTDAAIAMKKSMGAIIVVRQDVTTFDLLDSTVAGIEKAEVKILGVVVIGSESKQKKYGYYKRGKYGYKYNYQYHYAYKDTENDR